MNWQKIWLVLHREYLVNFKRPTFLFTAFGVPLLSFAAMFFITQFTVNRETNLDKWQRVAYIDEAGIVDEALVMPEKCECDYQPLTADFATEPDSDAARYEALQAAGIQRIQNDQLDGFFVITSHYTLTGSIELYTDRSVPNALRENVENFMWHQVNNKAPTDLPVPVERLGNQDFTIRDLSTGDAISEAALVGRFLLPFIFVMIYFMATNTTAQFMMSGVVEEKENRLMEILATSIKPLELLWGKMLGLGSLALTQVALWLVGGLLIGMLNADAREFLSGTTFKAGDLALLVVMFLFNFMLFSASMIGIGAAVTAEAESRQIAGFFTFLNILPIMLLVTFMNDPNGIIPMILSFIPFTAATALVLRVGLTTVPAWQLGVVAGIQIVMAVAIMWLAAKVFRLGMLMYGKPLTPRTLWHALREGRTTLTTASTQYESAKTNGNSAKKKRRLL